MTTYPSSMIDLEPFNKSLQHQPVLFDDIHTPEIPTALLPGVLGEFGSALATAAEIPPALVVMTLLGVISACVAKRFVVSPKESWLEAVNIYTLIALPPANNKSLVLRTCTRPLVDWETEQAVLLGNDIKRQRSERKSQEKIIEALRSKMAKEKDIAMQNHLKADIADKETALMEPAALPQLFANDATPESLAMSTHEQGGRFAVFSDEGGIIETLAGLYSNGAANLDIVLKGIDGGDIRVRRKDRSFNLNPYLTLVLAVQPQVLSNMSEKRAYCGNGALERFLYVLPKSTLGHRTHDKPGVPLALQSAYHAKIFALLNIKPIVVNHREQPRVLTLAPEALQEWRAFQVHIETQLRPDGKLAVCLGWGGKLCGVALRLAGLLHVAAEGENHFTISAECMQHALTLAALLTEHAIAAYSVFNIDQPTEDAKEILCWIKAHGQMVFTQTEIISAMRNRKLGKAKRLHEALSVLIDRNILSVQRLPAPKKPTLEYHVHPTVFNPHFS